MNRCVFAASIAAVLAAGCSSASSGNVAALDGSWNLTTAGISDPSTSADVLAQHTSSDANAFQLTLKNGSGTEQVTTMVGSNACVSKHGVTISMNTDGTGSITEGTPGTLVSGAAACDSATTRDYALFKAGATALRRVSLDGSRLVVMSAESSGAGAFFAVFSKG